MTMSSKSLMDTAEENEGLMRIFTSRGVPADVAAIIVGLLRGAANDPFDAQAAVVHGVSARAYHAMDPDERTAVVSQLDAVVGAADPKGRLAK